MKLCPNLSFENDWLGFGRTVVVTAIGFLVPCWAGRRVRDVLAGRSEEAAPVVTLPPGPGPVPQHVRSEGEDDADGRRELLREEDL